MIILEKIVDSINDAHKDFMYTIGLETEIIQSIQKFLHKKYPVPLQAINQDIKDITLCSESNSNTNISTSIEAINSYNYDTTDLEVIYRNELSKPTLMGNNEYKNNTNEKIYIIESYEEFVEWALWLCKDNIPSPFKVGYPACYCLNLTSNSFTIRFPNNTGIGVKVINGKKGIQYSLNILFYTVQGLNDAFIKETYLYKAALMSNWTEKPNKNIKTV